MEEVVRAKWSVDEANGNVDEIIKSGGMLEM